MDKKITTTDAKSTASTSAKTKTTTAANTTVTPAATASTSTLLPTSVTTPTTVAQLPLVPLAKKNKKVAKRKKVSQACIFCRRSHMTCDDGRPCQRCIKRNIAHLCRDEPKTNKKKKKGGKQDPKATTQQNKTTSTVAKTQLLMNTPTPTTPLTLQANPTNPSPISTPYTNLYLQQAINPFYNMNYTSFNPIFSNDYVGSELNVISDFLATLGDPNFNTQLAQSGSSNSNSNNSISASPIAPTAQVMATSNNRDNNVSTAAALISPLDISKQENDLSSTSTNTTTNPTNAYDAHESKTEQFILKAADPPHKTSAERLAAFLNAKYEAGLLKPFNHVNGYTRLQKYMEKNLSKSSRQRIINVIEMFRPSFRAVAQSLTDIDLILVEEAFERLLLEYDRVFTSMGIPSCLWRRTGEIFKSNKEFADLINMSMDDFKEGKFCIYELLAEESAVNYWEKYGNIAFDPGQKAVLTSCVLRNPKKPSQGVSCCFSFTIRRDKYNIPMMIVGNFLPA
ncbi:hypothetical protein BCR32DRAFT_294725 [Anaeromyces robustus]|uniref:Zn(2)-C6 fungal-type domain-containing protein n=1 Tax=Anaeromyces robustus TaxID=1754192 RepID=A0A1Y1WZH8_9FUNG|nr:hypothetical protein BCR32DRAFT_294725 [Anaeromyces robustus]|eukprot:ORX78969.1 hypothetical protein BCR32DRAFT_294725 [Anaeromyces robustus]